jgi:hypothetical protein
VLLVAPLAGAGLTLSLRYACPLYVSGKDSGFCNYHGVDVLGGWVSGVIVAFLVDAVVVTGLFVVTAWQVRERSGRDAAVSTGAA